MQNDGLAETHSITLCLLTTELHVSWSYRIEIEATHQNGLRERSAVMTDRLTSVQRFRLGERVGTIDEADLARVERAIRAFLALD